MFFSEIKGVSKICEYALGNLLASRENSSDEVIVQRFKKIL